MNQEETPLFNALKNYVNRDTLPLHVPGHKNGSGMEYDFKEFMGVNPFKIDLTVFKQVDSLHHPTGVIKKAQELAADAYGADATFFSVHGTSGAIQAMIMSSVCQGDKIIVPRNVHKSITTGIILSGAIPIFMEPEIDKTLGIAHGISTDTVKKTLSENPDVKCLLIINPTYYGVASDLKEIVNIVHSYNIPILVDEAHGPHLAFSDKLPISAIEAGADICCQSTHKLIGSLTQSSLLHVKSKYITPKRVQRNLNLLQTTSPSYILMASLDCARKQIALYGNDLLENTIELCNYTRTEINKIPGLFSFGEEILGKPGLFSFDPTKITISCRGLGITGYQLDMILSEKYAIQMELSDFYNVLAVGSFGDTKDGMNRLLNALREISNEYYGKNPFTQDFLDIPSIPQKIINPREAFYANKRPVTLEDSLGNISGEFLFAYPPGIPLLCPGELITADIINYVKDLKRANLYVQGTEDPDVKNIKILSI